MMRVTALVSVLALANAAPTPDASNTVTYYFGSR